MKDLHKHQDKKLHIRNILQRMIEWAVFVYSFGILFNPCSCRVSVLIWICAFLKISSFPRCTMYRVSHKTWEYVGDFNIVMHYTEFFFLWHSDQNNFQNVVCHFITFKITLYFNEFCPGFNFIFSVYL